MGGRGWHSPPPPHSHHGPPLPPSPIWLLIAHNKCDGQKIIAISPLATPPPPPPHKTKVWPTFGTPSPPPKKKDCYATVINYCKYILIEFVLAIFVSAIIFFIYIDFNFLLLICF